MNIIHAQKARLLIMMCCLMGILLVTPVEATSEWQGGGTIPQSNSLYLPVIYGIDLSQDPSQNHCTPSGATTALTVDAELLFISVCSRLEVYDLVDPDSPNLLGKITFQAGAIQEIDVQGDYAYLVSRSPGETTLPQGIIVVDISEPAAPTFVNFYFHPSIDSLAVQGSYAYVGGYSVESSNYFISTIDIDDPHNLVEIATYREDSLPVATHALHAEGDYLYGIGSGFQTYDLSEPAQLVRLSRSDAYPLWDMALQDNLAFIGWGEFFAQPTGGLLLYDITNPASPSEITNLDLGMEIISLDGSGNYAYLIVRYGGPKLLIYDISTPEAPVAVGELSISARHVVAEGSHVYLLGYTEAELSIVDVSIPSQPTIVYSKMLDNESGASN